MIVATAGHVDHGKTSLVRALTGIDTDTLAEERRRGLTIDLGFASAEASAWCDDGGGGADPATVAFVDVPGHERFLRNLLAGVTAVDAALLVIAADDGPMPQTREHLAVLRLLGLAPAGVVLTKIDRVSAGRRAEAEREIADLLHGSGRFAEAPVFGVVTPTGVGIAPLRHHLARLGRSLPARRDAGGHFRLAVDRSFTVAGAGRVVTGTALSGGVAVGDALVLAPGGAPVRVRGLQVHNRAVASAAAGQRVAVNIAGGSGLRAAEPARGDWLVAPPAQAPTSRIDVELELLADAPRPLASRAGLWLHLGAAAVPARLVVLFAAAVAPGRRGLAQLRLEQPVSAVQGEVFILRDPAAAPASASASASAGWRGGGGGGGGGGGVIVAGGRVVDPFAPARGRARPARAEFLAAMALRSPGDALARLAADPSGAGVDLDAFGRARNLTATELAKLQQALGLVEIADAAGAGAGVRGRDVGGGRRALAPERWQALLGQVAGAVGACHAQAPDSIGPSEAALAERLGLRHAGDHGSRLPAAPLPSRALLRAAIASLVAGGAVVREGLRLRLADHRPVPSAADAALLVRLAAQMRPGGLRPPIVGELAAGLAMPLPELLPRLAQLAALGLLVRLAPNRYCLPTTVGELAAHARQLSAEAQSRGGERAGFDAAAYRDRTGIGRNLTVQVLEFLDREGLTRFDGSRRRAIAAGPA